MGIEELGEITAEDVSLYWQYLLKTYAPAATAVENPIAPHKMGALKDLTARSLLDTA